MDDVKRMKSSSFRVTAKDHELIELLAAYYETSKSEVIRTAIRSLAASLGGLNPQDRRTYELEERLRDGN